jgi:hypothetical protein
MSEVEVKVLTQLIDELGNFCDVDDCSMEQATVVGRMLDIIERRLHQIEPGEHANQSSGLRPRENIADDPRSGLDRRVDFSLEKAAGLASDYEINRGRHAALAKTRARVRNAVAGPGAGNVIHIKR